MSSEDLKQMAELAPGDIQPLVKVTKPETPAPDSEDEFFSCRETENSAQGSPNEDPSGKKPSKSCDTEMKCEDAQKEETSDTGATNSGKMDTVAETHTVEDTTATVPKEGQEDPPTVTEEVKSEPVSVPVPDPQPGTGSQPTPNLPAPDAKTLSECDTTASETKTPGTVGTATSH